MGFTELTVRYIAWQSYNDYAGYNVGIMAGNNGTLARKNLRRLAKLFTAHHPEEIKSRKDNIIELNTGTVIESFAASEESHDRRYEIPLRIP